MKIPIRKTNRRIKRSDWVLGEGYDYNKLLVTDITRVPKNVSRFTGVKTRYLIDGFDEKNMKSWSNPDMWGVPSDKYIKKPLFTRVINKLKGK